ncbi:chromosome segregation and condensation protein ScpB [Nitritalea halalkaliphila LW7]|uniref:Chromosome segregation and condensation protein ScpB n=1 Tax=Nitritalea halalkaliphila LW7 TaxID=1189621 RepID=I5BUW3_9BACT|nr:SMC-Scp complex subunit ScpB [Nitritalea halalkaliphila]EIM73365.1 chromosome segregation and condensation protein ScpB [Nitritalea halalkaliphila LW7]
MLERHVEALVFCSTAPIKVREIQACLEDMFGTVVEEAHIQEALERLRVRYADEQFSFGLEQLSGGYQFLSKPAYHPALSVLLKQQTKRRLSVAQMETLAIIAYKQPVTKSEIEHIRGVNCDYAVGKLLEKELITIRGKSDAIGRPLLYGTSDKFMEYFSINDLRDLPQPKDFSAEENEIGLELKERED